MKQQKRSTKCDCGGMFENLTSSMGVVVVLVFFLDVRRGGRSGGLLTSALGFNGVFSTDGESFCMLDTMSGMAWCPTCQLPIAPIGGTSTLVKRVQKC